MSRGFWIELIGESLIYTIFGVVIWRKFDRLDRGLAEIRERMITKDDIAELREAISPRGVISSSN